MKLLPKLPLSVLVKEKLGYGVDCGFHHSVTQHPQMLFKQMMHAGHFQKGRGNGEQRNSRKTFLLVVSLWLLGKYRQN